MATAVIKGAVAPFRGPAETDESAGNIWRVTAEWHGPYAALKAAKPAVGTAIAGFDPSLLVSSAKVTRDEGGYGTLSIVLEATTPATGELIGFTRETLEISQMLVERPLLDHPALTAGAGEMADDISRWWNGSDPQLKYQWQYVDENEVIQPLEDEEIKWAKKLLRGVETWKDFVPVIRRRRTYNGIPTTSTCGTIDTPPISVNGVTNYLKTADDATEDDNGNSIRVEEWTGASGGWDEDIYGASSRAAARQATGKKGRRSK